VSVGHLCICTSAGQPGKDVPAATMCSWKHLFNFLFFNFPIYLQSVEIHSSNGVLGSEGG
jgi:hypothetical protein